MIFLTNPRKGRQTRMARKRRTAAQRAATRKLIAFNKARKRKTTTRKRRRKVAAPARRRKRRTTARKRITRRNPVAARRRKRRSPVRRRAAARRPVRRRRYRRNQPQRFTVRNLGKQLQQGVFDAAGVVAGKAATRIVANLIPLGGETAIMVFAKQAISAIGVGTVASMFLSRDVARMLVAGGLAAPVEQFMVNIPFIGPMLADYDPFLPMGDADPFLPMGEYPAVGDSASAYGEDPYGPGVGEYPANGAPASIGEYY